MMPSALDPPSADQGCLALLVSTAIAALLLMLALFQPWGCSLGLYLAIFAVTGLVVAIFGLPLYLLALRLRRTRPLDAVLAGALTGAVLPLLSALGDVPPEQRGYVFAYAAIGAVGGAAFFLAASARRNPARNIALLLALAGAAIAATPFAAVLLSPPVPSSAAR